MNFSMQSILIELSLKLLFKTNRLTDPGYMCSTSLFVNTFQFYFMIFLLSYLKKALGFPRHK